MARIGFTLEHLQILRFVAGAQDCTAADYIRSVNEEPFSAEGLRVYSLIRTLIKYGYLSAAKKGSALHLSLTLQARNEIRAIAEVAKEITTSTR